MTCQLVVRLALPLNLLILFTSSAITEQDHKKKDDESDGYTRQIAHAYYERGNYYHKKKAYDKAIADLTDAIRLDPEFLNAYVQRGYAFFCKKDYEKAKSDYEKALKLNDKYYRGNEAMAWLLATCPEEKFRNGKKAVELATKARDLTEGKNPYVLDTLAAAYAEVGQFNEAVGWQLKAIDSPGLVREHLARFQERLKLYQASKPFRDNQ